MKVSDAVRAALDELHFSVKAFSDAIVFGKSPHTGDRFSPRAEGIGEGDERLEEAALKPVNELQELTRQRAARLIGLVLLVEESAEFLHLVIEGLEGREGLKELEQKIGRAHV